MSELGTTSIGEGSAALECLIQEVQASNVDWNEAETKFQIINRFIVECLGWPRELIRLERGHNRTYSDYELGAPRCAIWEAKRGRGYF